MRKALGKVRRLSIPFLRDERIRLEYHRNAARAKVEANLKGQTLNKEEIEKLARAERYAELIDPRTIHCWSKSFGETSVS